MKILKKIFFSSIYIPQMISISSKIPFILYLLLKYIFHKNEVKIPIEKIIVNIMMEI